MIPVELTVDAFLGDDYIPETTLKMEVYHRLIHSNCISEIADIAAEITDRYGSPPVPAQNLLAITRIRLLAQEAGVRSIQQKGAVIELSLGRHSNLRGEKLIRLTQYFPKKLSFSSAQGLNISLRVIGLDQQGVLALLEQILERIKHLIVEAVS